MRRNETYVDDSQIKIGAHQVCRENKNLLKGRKQLRLKEFQQLCIWHWGG
jgi:hypothetical protein